ncbi:MAG: CoA transferase, partial [Actinobacteria bacterium]|nr:CoA transferase [Actinomycetota bacterium]
MDAAAPSAGDDPGLGVQAVEGLLDAAAGRLGDELGVDGPALLRERRELLGIAPAGTVSAGGSCRLLSADDGWFALNLARADDREAVAAWMGREWDGPVWDGVAAAAAGMSATDAVDRAQLLGIPAAVAVAPEEFIGPTVAVEEDAGGRWTRAEPRPLVVDLSSLWAGPLCARLLGAALDARVVKVEHVARPDGARSGPPAFWRSLNAHKEERHLDFSTATGRAELADLLARARVVVSAARPRALAQLGLDPAEHAARGAVWVSITGYGRSGLHADWVAFGDDAAVAGGVAVAAGGPDAPVFAGDA